MDRQTGEWNETALMLAVYFNYRDVVTTLLAVILGVILVTSIKPGESVDGSNHVEPTGIKKKNVTTVDTMLDLIRNCVPPNVVQATMQQYRTHLIYPEVDNVRKLISL